MQNVHPTIAALVLTAFLFAGCAATPSVQQVRPIDADLSRYTALQVVVDAPDHIRKQSGYEITVAELQREFIAIVSATGKFATLGMEARAGKRLEARLTITELNYVSGASRGMVGILAGRAILHVTMTLKDMDTAAMLGTVTAGHTSSLGQGVFSPVTSAQITAIAKEFSIRITER